LKKIIKTKEPQSLTKYRSTIAKENLSDSNIYKDFSCKTKLGCENNEINNLRKQLLEEQGYICCYCMSRINCKNSKIEHFRPQEEHRDLQISYKNLFIACSGGEGKQKKVQHCDTYKGKDELNHINLLSNIENNIAYKKEDKDNITIYSTDSNIDTELNEILNLNCNTLKRNRKDTYDTILQQLKNQNFAPSTIKKVIKNYKSKNNNKFQPYSEMVVYFLTKKLNSKGIKI
jgi:uncharacterized protein (TIGR02646 family)